MRCGIAWYISPPKMADAAGCSRDRWHCDQHFKLGLKWGPDRQTSAARLPGSLVRVNWNHGWSSWLLPGPAWVQWSRIPGNSESETSKAWTMSCNSPHPPANPSLHLSILLQHVIVLKMWLLPSFCSCLPQAAVASLRLTCNSQPPLAIAPLQLWLHHWPQLTITPLQLLSICSSRLVDFMCQT